MGNFSVYDRTGGVGLRDLVLVHRSLQVVLQCLHGRLVHDTRLEGENLVLEQKKVGDEVRVERHRAAAHRFVVLQDAIHKILSFCVQRHFKPFLVRTLSLSSHDGVL